MRTARIPARLSEKKKILVIPCYNEERRLQALEYTKFARGSRAFQLLFVDDGSSDRTSSVVSDLSKKLKFGNPLLLARNSGKGEAVRKGLLTAIERGATYVGFIDADGSIPLDEAQRTLSLLGDGTEVVLGSRVQMLGYEIQRDVFRHYLGRVFATCASMCLGIPVYDTQCGLKWFQVTPALKRALSEPFYSRWAFDVELLGRLSHEVPLDRFEEAPLRIWKEVGGSKVRPWDLPKTILQLFFIRRALNQWRAKHLHGG